MSSLSEQIYFRSPVWAQNLAVSLYGAGLRDKRYRGCHDRRLAELRDSARRDPEQLRRFQWTVFRELLEHSFERIPFYRELTARTGLQPQDLGSFDDLPLLPIVEKEELRAAPEHYCDPEVLRGKPLVFHTSGTTGKALTIYCDRESRRHHYAFWTRLREWHGLGPKDRRATMFGRIIHDPDNARPPFWRYDRVGRNLLMSSYHLAEEHLPHYVDQLERYEPAEIIGYASSVFLLAKYILREAPGRVRPRVVFTTADTLFPHQRRVIEQAFACPVIDQYGCAEMAIFAADDGQANYQVHGEHGLLEVLGEGDRPVGPGETGEAVCTGFINRTMPLIRYRIGDRVSLREDETVQDGLVTRFAEIVGRVDDVLVSPDGRPLGRLSPIWKVVPGIFETQVIQKTVDSLDINLVVDESFRARGNALGELETEIRKRTGSAMELRFHLLEEIPKNKNGKFRAVVSEVDSGGV